MPQINWIPQLECPKKVHTQNPCYCFVCTSRRCFNWWLTGASTTPLSLRTHKSLGPTFTELAHPPVSLPLSPPHSKLTKSLEGTTHLTLFQAHTKGLAANRLTFMQEAMYLWSASLQLAPARQLELAASSSQVASYLSTTTSQLNAKQSTYLKKRESRSCFPLLPKVIFLELKKGRLRLLLLAYFKLSSAPSLKVQLLPYLCQIHPWPSSTYSLEQPGAAKVEELQ